MNPEDQFISDLKASLGDNYSVNVNSYDITDLFRNQKFGSKSLKPEDMFTHEELDKWALENGYVKFY